jgi:hypothetical protein
MRKLIYQNIQSLFVGASDTITLRTPFFVQPLQGYEGALRGTAFDAQKVIEPQVVVHVEDLAGVGGLLTWQAQVETTYRGILGDSDFYSSIGDVTGQWILQGGNFVPEILGHALARAGFILTNRDTTGHTVLVRVEVFGQMWWDDPLNTGTAS